MKTRLIFVVTLLIMGLALPAFAHEGETLTVVYDNLSLTIDKDFASDVSVVNIPADPPEYGPGFAEPASIQIGFANPPEGFYPDSILTLRFYDVQNFADYPEHQKRLEQLQMLLKDRPDLTSYLEVRENVSENTLPFIPVYPHGQILRARAEYVETPILRGIEYITAFSADVSPFTSTSFLYTFQGVTLDGAHYVSGQGFVTTSLFPVEISAFDPAEFQAELNTYLNESVATLNGAKVEDFSPSLDELNTVIQSIMMTPPPQA